MEEREQKLQHILNNAIDPKKVWGTSFGIQYQNQTWFGSSGNLSTQNQFFIASTTKLFVTAILLHLEAQKKLSLQDPIAKYLSQDILTGLHVLNKQDYSNQITLKNLLAHTSGIPDYFQQKNKSGNSLETDILSGHDQSWTFEKCLEISKSISPKFIPNTPGKTHYSDTNFQLLGKIIENITSKSFVENLNEIILNPLELSNTYLYTDPSDNRPQKMYYKNKEIDIPLAMSSFGPDGGMVSTSPDLLKFITAFFTGKLFPISFLNYLEVWNKLFFPLEAGVGIQRFKLPWILNPMGTIPVIMGHSGLSGALAYYCPEKDLYIAGTVNQIAFPDTSFRLSIKLIQSALK
jgi:CubicO group peptidase (beta-lactamase class C family)